jgi:glyoxylase-like metal-dependent hydrolase (beta-lactamase superfamily II)
VKHLAHLLIVLGLLVGGCASKIEAATTSTTIMTAQPAVSVTSFASGPKFSVNAHLIAAPGGLVVIDTMRTRMDVEALIGDIRSRTVPLKAILLTHTHPDHIGGLDAMKAAFPQAEIIAAEITKTDIRDDRTGMISSGRRFVKGFRPDVPLPTRIISDQEVFDVAGIKFEAQILGAGEAEAMTVFIARDLGAVFVGDMVGDGLTPWLVEGRSAAWLSQLAAAKNDYVAIDKLFPGHGKPGPTQTLINAQADYISTVRNLVSQRLQDRQLSSEESKEIIETLAQRFPFTDQVAPMPNLAQANLDAIAKEILAN